MYFSHFCRHKEKYQHPYSRPSFFIISVPIINGSLSKLKFLKEHEQDPTMFLQCFSTLWGLFSGLLWWGERQIKTLQGQTTFFCECFHAVCCADLLLSVFLLAFLHTYPQTFISQFNNINKKGRVALMSRYIFGGSQQLRLAGLHAESLAQWRSSTIWKPVIVSLFYLSTMKCIQNYRTATVPLQIQLHHQRWVSGHNSWAPASPSHKHWRSISESSAEHRWCLLSDWPWSWELLKYQN